MKKIFKNILSAIFLIFVFACFGIAFSMAELDSSDLVFFILVIFICGTILINPEPVINFWLRLRGRGDLSMNKSKEGVRIWRATAAAIMTIMLIATFIYFMKYVWGYENAFNEFLIKLSNILLTF